MPSALMAAHVQIEPASGILPGINSDVATRLIDNACEAEDRDKIDRRRGAHHRQLRADNAANRVKPRKIEPVFTIVAADDGGRHDRVLRGDIHEAKCPHANAAKQLPGLLKYLLPL